jgi:hypothetical protein
MFSSTNIVNLNVKPHYMIDSNSSSQENLHRFNVMCIFRAIDVLACIYHQSHVLLVANK